MSIARYLFDVRKREADQKIVAKRVGFATLLVSV